MGATPLTILVEDVETLLDQQRRVQHDQAVAYWQHIVASSRFEEGAYRPLASCQHARIYSRLYRNLTRLSICSLSAAGSVGRASRLRGATKAGASSVMEFAAVSTPDIV